MLVDVVDELLGAGDLGGQLGVGAAAGVGHVVHLVDQVAADLVGAVLELQVRDEREPHVDLDGELHVLGGVTRPGRRLAEAGLRGPVGGDEGGGVAGLLLARHLVVLVQHDVRLAVLTGEVDDQVELVRPPGTRAEHRLGRHRQVAVERLTDQPDELLAAQRGALEALQALVDLDGDLRPLGEDVRREVLVRDTGRGGGGPVGGAAHALEQPGLVVRLVVQGDDTAAAVRPLQRTQLHQQDVALPLGADALLVLGLAQVVRLVVLGGLPGDRVQLLSPGHRRDRLVHLAVVALDVAVAAGQVEQPARRALGHRLELTGVQVLVDRVGQDHARPHRVAVHEDHVVGVAVGEAEVLAAGGGRRAGRPGAEEDDCLEPPRPP